MRGLLKNIFIAINIPVAACLLFSYTAVYFNPANFLVPAFLGLAYPYIFLVNILFVLYWFIFNAKYSLISVVAILAGFGILSNYVQLKGNKTEVPGINICSYNVKYFVGKGVSPTIKSVDAIADFLEEGKFDIICLQEASITSKNFRMNAIKNRLGNINHMQPVYASWKGGPVTYTRYPVIGMGEIRYEKSNNMVLYTDLIIQKDTFRVYNCHLQSYRLKPHELNSLDSIRFSNNPKNYTDVKNVGSKLKQAFIQRSKQALMLREHINRSPYPVIVCGDFNDTPVSFAYHTVKDGLLDAFVESGQGIGNTYNGRLPSFRIDYILHDPAFSSFNFETGKIKFSDHFPVYCKLLLNEKN